MALDKEEQSKLEAKFRDALKAQYQRGFQDGIKTISKVVLNRLNNSSIPLMKRIEAVKKLCATPFRNKEQVKPVEQEEETTSENGAS